MAAKRTPERRNSRIDLVNTPQYRPEFGREGHEEVSEKLWELCSEYIDSSVLTIQKSIATHCERTLARTRFNFDENCCYQATSLSVRDRLLESWNDTSQYFTNQDVKRVYYMSLEFLIGRLLQNNLVNLALEEPYKVGLMELGYDLENIYGEECDPGLGNGGLGRLAACFLDSMATLDYPCWGYGIRYDFGIFKQQIVQGYQVEIPDYWLADMNPWEIERKDIVYNIGFYGKVRKWQENGEEKSAWEPGEIVRACAYDTPIPGYNTWNTINLRLWSSKPTNQFDFDSFNQGDYFKAIEQRQRAEYITSVLYPNDSTYEGKELRLKQQYFFCAATCRDVLRRFLKKPYREWEELPQKVSIQLNDTHPALAIPELIRLLVDEHNLSWKKAWNLVSKTFSYTNHTVLPEALEKWSVDLLGNLLPRHLEIIYLINHYFMQEVGAKFAGDDQKRHENMAAMSLVEEGDHKQIRMANLSIVASHAVNGVAALHTKLVQDKIFWHFNQYFPGRIRNKTNGVTPRRWVYCCNPSLANILTKNLGDEGWVGDLSLLRTLQSKIEDATFRADFVQAKMECKDRLIEWVKENCGVELNRDAIFDIMVKRIHEYKRQKLFGMYMVHKYLQLKSMSPQDRANHPKRVYMVAGKAAPGYVQAKRCIKFISSIGDVVNNDPEIGDIMKVLFLPNYNVSNAQIIIPAADVTQQISTAGYEASGTGNMKFVMNGAIIVGTMDGANVEIAEEVGEDNMFIFGARVHEVEGIRQELGSRSHHDTHLGRVFEAMNSGRFGNPKEMGPLFESLQGGNDFYILTHDFYDYVEKMDAAQRMYVEQPEQWQKMSIAGILSMDKFSSDRTIKEYADDIWNVQPCKIPTPASTEMNRVKSQSNVVSAKEVQKAKKESMLEQSEKIGSQIDLQKLEQGLEKREDEPDEQAQEADPATQVSV